MSGVALVTGGQSGIGLGVSKRLAAAGFSVAMIAERAADHPDVQAALATVPGAIYRQHDLKKINNIKLFIDEIESDLGAVTALVSNAGVPSPVRGDMLDVTPEALRHVLAVNVEGAYFLAQEAARRMIGRPGAPYRSITFVTSVSAEMVSIERADYCISKAAASMMAKAFAARLASEGIGVFEVRPGIIETAMTAGVRDKYDARMAEGLVPAGRWGTSDDVGRAVVPIALGEMAFATGSVLALDGGLSIARL
jgi:NAD(P)-dependent dehydrogenase (short-subunit alcohol dehydrogenase family)